MRVERTAVVLGRTELVSRKEMSVSIGGCGRASARDADGDFGETYRERGSWALRPLARVTGSNDFAIASDTGVVKDDAVSSSSSWSDKRLDGASSEALRRPKKACARVEGTNALGTARARYLDDSLTAILQAMAMW